MHAKGKRREKSQLKNGTEKSFFSFVFKKRKNLSSLCSWQTAFQNPNLTEFTPYPIIAVRYECQ